ncbi:hypothetical protein BDB01DRAFT_898151 [Pilobolus umbonatus]|nr:hypothetical protein BDB01DRAFT_898151 [Pilobolus umbonatus]
MSNIPTQSYKIKELSYNVEYSDIIKITSDIHITKRRRWLLFPWRQPISNSVNYGLRTPCIDKCPHPIIKIKASDIGSKLAAFTFIFYSVLLCLLGGTLIE